MRLTLQPGTRSVVRPPDRLTLVGAGAARERVTLPDTPVVRRLLEVLVTGEVPARDAATQRALRRIVEAGLTEPAGAASARHSARTEARVLVDAPPELVSPAVELLMACGVGVTTRDGAATHALVAATTEVDRRRLENWIRRGIPHLLVVDRLRSVVVGPFVVPGRTACALCLDAHRAESDPDHAGVVAALPDARLVGPPLRPAAPVGSDAPLRSAALAWAVRDLVSVVEGQRPSTWSATVTLHADAELGMSADRETWRRHAACGCAWADDLTAGRRTG